MILLQPINDNDVVTWQRCVNDMQLCLNGNVLKWFVYATTNVANCEFWVKWVEWN
jgi:hypothetical protein